MRFTIAMKIFCAYIAMVFLTLIVSFYSLSVLWDLNKITQRVLQQDFKNSDILKSLIDNIIVQQRYEKKFIVLHDKILEDIFWEKSKSFERNIKLLSDKDLDKKLIRDITRYHKEYEDLFIKEIELIKKGGEKKAYKLSQEIGKEKLDFITEKLKYLQEVNKHSVDQKINLSNIRGRKAFTISIILSLFAILAGMGFALAITYSISRPISKLKEATKLIAKGNFDHPLNIKNKDEIGDLTKLFEIMSQKLKQLEEIYLDTSPLTRLPGNVVIERELVARLKRKEKFSLCHVDLDDFKPFADRYGYARASNVIKMVARLISNAINEFGNHSLDFAGHIGGDDFIIICSTNRVDNIVKKVVTDFDKEILEFYDSEDRSKGRIMSKDRLGVERYFSIMTITIAVVENGKIHYESPLEISAVAAELKEYAKSLPGSNYIKEKRKSKEKVGSSIN
jgi:diguanylate cyclase (GGDEF)-like protein